MSSLFNIFYDSYNLLNKNINKYVDELEKNNLLKLNECQNKYDEIIKKQDVILQDVQNDLKMVTKELEETKEKLSNIKKALGV